MLINDFYYYFCWGNLDIKFRLEKFIGWYDTMENVMKHLYMNVWSHCPLRNHLVMNPPSNNHTIEPRDLGNSSANFNGVNSLQSKVSSEAKFQHILHSPVMTGKINFNPTLTFCDCVLMLIEIMRYKWINNFLIRNATHVVKLNTKIYRKANIINFLTFNSNLFVKTGIIDMWYAQMLCLCIK